MTPTDKEVADAARAVFAAWDVYYARRTDAALARYRAKQRALLRLFGRDKDGLPKKGKSDD